MICQRSRLCVLIFHWSDTISFFVIIQNSLIFAIGGWILWARQKNWFVLSMMNCQSNDLVILRKVDLFLCNDTFWVKNYFFCENSRFVDFWIGGWIRWARQMNWFVVDMMNCQFNDLPTERRDAEYGTENKTSIFD